MQGKSMVRFEHDKYEKVEGIDVEKLDRFLQDVWKNRKLLKESDEEDVIIDEEKLSQPYLKIKDGKIKPRNYIGFIYFEGQTIEIYPKVFKDNWDEANRQIVFRNILHWLKYYEKFKIPYTESQLDVEFNDFLELFLYLVTQLIFETVRKNPYYQFKEIEKTLYTPRGRIDFNDYALRKMPAGKWEQFDCVYEPFIYDNRTNQVIKYTCRLIKSITKNDTTKKLLREILFVMDEVSDRICTVYDVDSIFVNPLFQDYENILYYCRMIIEQRVYSNQSFETSQLCFLFPMEKIFEDFVAGKLKDMKLNVEKQKSDMYLATFEGNNAFQMQHDIFIKAPPVIIDTKYKIRSETGDLKHGIAQGDMYQLVSYGFRRGIERLYLFYPNIKDFAADDFNFAENVYKVQSGFDDETELTITAVNVPFWSFDDDYKDILDEKFEILADILLTENIFEEATG